MSGEDLGAEWGASPGGDDLGSDWGKGAPVVRRSKAKTTPAPRPALTAPDSTIQQTAPGQFSGETRVTADPSAWDQFKNSVGNVTRDIFPNVVQQAENGNAFPAWAGIRDAATIVPRIAAATGTALGEYAGNPDATAASSLEQGANTLRDPIRETEAATPNTLARIGAGMANDPTTLPMAFMPAGRGVLGAMIAGGRMGAGTYGAHVLDRYGLEGQSAKDALTGETLGQAAQDILPIVLPPALRYGQKTAGEILSPLVKYVGARGVEKARQMVTSMFKTAPQIKQGQTWEGLQSTLAGNVNGKPIFPQIVTEETHNVPDVVNNYKALFGKVKEGFDPTLDALEKEGVRIPARPIVNATSGELERLKVDPGSMKAWAPTDVAQANQFVRRSLLKHEGDIEKQALFDAVAAKEKDPEFYIAKNGIKIAPIKYAYGVRSGTILPGEFEPAYGLKNGSVVTQSELMNPTLSPRGAQTAGSAMREEAFKRTAEQSLAKETAARFAGAETRKYLTDPALHPGITPQGATLLGDFDRLLKNSAPLYAGEEAMTRAERVTANRNPISLSKAQVVLNPVKAFKLAAQEDPAVARQVYDYAMGTHRLQPLATWLIDSKTSQLLGAKELPAIATQAARSAIMQKQERKR